MEKNKKKGNHMFQAKDIMTTELVTIKRSTNIHEAIRILVENNITGLPVVNDDMTVAGIISEKDMLGLLYNIEDKPGNVEQFMTEEVVCFDKEDSLIDIAESFMKSSFRRVPILDEGRLVGIISRKDIIGYILKLRHKDKVEV
jgi:CBS domain-containing protein